MIGSFLFATHTTVCSGILWYQIPRYLLVELPGLKNPSAKLFPSEIRTSPSLMVWLVFKESWDVQDEKWRIKREKNRNGFSASIIGKLDLGFWTIWMLLCGERRSSSDKCGTIREVTWKKLLLWDFPFHGRIFLE